MNHFISCDWGTSSFRLRLINTETKTVFAETKSAQGIAATYALWKETTADRISFYTGIIINQILLLQQQCGYSLDNVDIVISGMASASIGMVELPYKPIPFSINNAELETHTIPATKLCLHKMIIISGIRSSNDVMRGEETMLAGCSINNADEEQLFIFPGTHSKHVTIQNGIIKDFKTYITGEVFDLLSSKSILAASIEKESNSYKNNNAFIKGVSDAAHSNILNSIFHVRTNDLFGNLGKNENYHYLSGLLIGEELKNIKAKNTETVTIVSSLPLLALYTEALTALGFKAMLKQQNADEALINGQALILKHNQ